MRSGNHFKLKVIWRKWPDSGLLVLLDARLYRPASSFSRSTIGEAGSASGAIAVK